VTKEGYHLWQSQLCSATFCPANYPPDQVFIASDLNLYYDSKHTNWYKRPDWYAVIGISRFYQGRDLRLSYVIWQEEVKPIVVLELLSPSTRNEYLGKKRKKGEQPTKWEVYEQIIGIPYYIVFDRYTNELQAFQLQGNRYRKMELTEAKVWIPPLKIGLGLWQGNYQGERLWLRWYDADGNWISTEAERERQAKESAQQEVERQRQEAERQRQRAEHLARQLREAGIAPEQF
jgi:Uma2 family endonuclease